MKEVPHERFEHIRDAVVSILDFGAIDLKDIKTYSAVVYQLQIIGEAVKHAPDAIKAKHAHIPWRKMATFRNYAVHEYYMLDIKAIQEALNALPELLDAINTIITESKHE